MKKFVAVIVMLVVLVGSAFADGIMYPEIESMIPEEEHTWFRIVFTMSGDPELEEAPDPYKTYTVVVYVMQDDSDYGKPGYLGLYEDGKCIDLVSGYIVPEVIRETAADTIEEIKKDISFNMPNVCFGETTLYEEILK